MGLFEILLCVMVGVLAVVLTSIKNIKIDFKDDENNNDSSQNKMEYT